MKKHFASFLGGIFAALSVVLLASAFAQNQTSQQSVASAAAGRRDVFAAAVMNAAFVHYKDGPTDNELDGLIDRAFKIADRIVEKHS